MLVIPLWGRHYGPHAYLSLWGALIRLDCSGAFGCYLCHASRTVRPVMANSWANPFNGQVSSGVAYRAKALMVGESVE